VRTTKTTTAQVKGYRSYVWASLACAAVAVTLAPVLLAGLIGWPVGVPRAVEQAGFALGVGTYCAWRVCRWRASSGAHAVGAVWPLGLAPTLLLIEGGVAGFVAFNSNWRYAPLALAVWGCIGLLRNVLSVVYLKLAARRS
jgi:hypothetical protein